MDFLYGQPRSSDNNNNNEVGNIQFIHIAHILLLYYMKRT